MELSTPLARARCHRASHRAPRVAALAAALLVAATAATDARAAEDEWTVGGGLVAATIPTDANGVVGLGATFHVRYGLTESLSLAAGALYSHHFPSPSTDEAEEEGNEPIDLVIPRLGLRYALDVLDLVPYLLLDATAYIANDAFFGEEGQIAGAGLMAGLGLEYRRWRDLSLGLELGYHAFLSDISDYPVYVSLSFHANWHSDPF